MLKALSIGYGLAGLLISAGVASAAPAVAETDLNIRSGPGTEYPVIGVIPGGATADVGACTGSWCAVAYRGERGYSSRAYLALSGGGAVYGYVEPYSSYGYYPYGSYAYEPGYYDYGLYGYGPSFGFGFGTFYGGRDRFFRDRRFEHRGPVNPGQAGPVGNRPGGLALGGPSGAGAGNIGRGPGGGIGAAGPAPGAGAPAAFAAGGANAPAGGAAIGGGGARGGGGNRGR